MINKQKGSFALVALICSMICLGLGIFYGLNQTRAEPHITRGVAGFLELDTSGGNSGRAFKD